MSPAPAPSAPPASAVGLTPDERRDLGVRLQPDLCQEAAKKVNLVSGRPETDKKGVEVLTRCLRLGNVAWYRCLVSADTPANVQLCHTRLLLPLDEVPGAQRGPATR